MPNRLSNLWQELKRRKVIRFVLIYAPTAFVLLEVYDIIADNYGFQPWAFNLFLTILILGFVILIILSWIFDFTPEGLQRTRSLEYEQSETRQEQQSVPDASFDGSIAVLPFQDMSPEKDQEYFCEGISEEIINALCRVERLKVIARTSAFAFKGRQVDIREIGKSLNVEHILEGSIRKQNNQLRITAQLIRAKDGSHLWSETYNRELKDIFNIQEEISLAMVEKLQMNIRGGALGGILKRHTENPDAYQYYLKGLFYWQMMTPEGNQKAQENYRKAIETDPDYALVYSILGSNFMFAGMQGFIPPKVAVKHAREYTEKALEIDGSIAVAHSTLGAISERYDWNMEACRENVLKSVQLNPNTAWDRFFYAWYLRTVGRFDEAVAESLIALEKDPFNIFICTEIGRTFLLAGRIDEAIERQNSTINLYPHGYMSHLNLGEALEVKGQLDRAIKSYEQAVALSPGAPRAETALAAAWYKAGKIQEAREKVNQVEQMRDTMYLPASLLVPFYLLEKDLDRAHQWFQIACEERDLLLIDFVNTPIIDHRLPADPRFQTLLEQTGLNAFIL